MESFRKYLSLRALLFLALSMMAVGCAEGEPAEDCPCGIYAYECVPCPEGDLGLALPSGDVGVPFLNEELIEAEQGYYLNQEGSGEYTMYTGEDNEIGVRVVNYFGNPASGVRVNFRVL